MSSISPQPDNQPSTWFAMSVLAWLLVVVAVAMAFLEGLRFGELLSCVLLVSLIIRLRWWPGMYIMVIAETGYMYFSENRWLIPRQERLYNEDLVFVALVLIFLGCGFRYLALSKFVNAFELPKLRPKTPNQTDNNHYWTVLGGRWWIVLLSLVIAFELLSRIPQYSRPSEQLLWIKPTGARLIFLGLLLFFVWFIARCIASLIKTIKMDTDQAGIYLRSELAKEQWSGLSGIEKRVAKLKSRNKPS